MSRHLVEVYSKSRKVIEVKDFVCWLSTVQWKSIVDYALIIVPIIVSCVAIGISVSTAKKQNKIALFEKRFEAYANLLKLKSFSDMLKREECSFDIKLLAPVNPQNTEGEIGRRCSEVLTNFQAFFYDGEKRPDSVNVARVMLYIVRRLELSLQTLPMLYSKELKNIGPNTNKEITIIFEDLAEFINSLTTGGSDKELRRANFVTNMDAFVDKYSSIFENGIQI